MKVRESAWLAAHSFLPANDEMGHGNQKGPKRHQYTADCYDLGSVEPGAKVAHKCNHQQIPFREVRKREANVKRAHGKGIKHPTGCLETSK